MERGELETSVNEGWAARMGKNTKKDDGNPAYEGWAGALRFIRTLYPIFAPREKGAAAAREVA